MKDFKKIPLILLLVLQVGFCLASGNHPGGHYWISFSDKNGTPYSINQPNHFLSERAIERRARQSIPITETDFPPNPNYINAIKEIGTIEIYYTSRWFNGALIFSHTGVEIETIFALPFVSEVELVKPIIDKRFGSELVVFDKWKEFEKLNNKYSKIGELVVNDAKLINLGLSAPSIDQLNGQFLISNGYLGQGKMIAVLDAGFTNVHQLNAFEHLRNEERIVGTRDFVDLNQNIYNSHGHGTVVLSVMAANLPGQLFGTSIGAEYWLIRTEDGATEFRIEEYNWLAGAELADSAGVDIINSSLGYSEFNVPWQNYTYEQMDGQTTVVARAANFAYERGMVVVASAGNSGQSPWYYIVSPSDAFGALSIGAVSAGGERAPFSSVGPSADLRVKPDVMAHGWGVPVMPPSGNIGSTSGTSLSSPVISGLLAALWQKHPDATAEQIYDALRTSSSMHLNPNEFFGYGIPDFALASTILSSVINEPTSGELRVFPNPFSNYINFVFVFSQADIATLEVFTLAGQRVGEISGIDVVSGVNIIQHLVISGLENGVYLLRLTTNNSGQVFYNKVVKAGI